MSHSSRVRGLKQQCCLLSSFPLRVALFTSAWIETSIRRWAEALQAVALFTSAWIETCDAQRSESFSRRRTLHECVDWNWYLSFKFGYVAVALFTSAWIETQKSVEKFSEDIVALFTSAWIETVSVHYVFHARLCRTLHECVDWNR